MKCETTHTEQTVPVSVPGSSKQYIQILRFGTQWKSLPG